MTRAGRPRAVRASERRGGPTWPPAGQSTSVRAVTRPSTARLLAVCAALALPALAADPAAVAPAAEPAPAKAGNPPAPADVAGEVRPQTAQERKAAREELEKELGEVSPEETEGMGFMLVRTFVVLAVVILSIYLTLNFGLRRLMGLKGPVGSGGLVTVLERVALDQRRSLFVVKAGGEYLLVGGGEGALNLLCKLTPEEVERAQRERSAQAMTMSPFLQKLLSRRGPP